MLHCGHVSNVYPPTFFGRNHLGIEASVAHHTPQCFSIFARLQTLCPWLTNILLMKVDYPIKEVADNLLDDIRST